MKISVEKVFVCDKITGLHNNNSIAHMLKHRLMLYLHSLSKEISNQDMVFIEFTHQPVITVCFALFTIYDMQGIAIFTAIIKENLFGECIKTLEPSD